MDLITDLSPLSPGLIDELEAFMGPVGECVYPPPDTRPAGGHQLPESPPDSGSEHPYSPDNVPQVLAPDYMLVHDMQSDMLQSQEYITYEELKSDGLGLGGVPIPPEQMLGLYRYGIQELDQGIISPQLVANHEPAPVYTALTEPSGKKRKHSLEANSQVKCEPAVLSPECVPPQPPPAPASIDGSEAGDDSFQCIRFSAFQQNTWKQLYDHNLKLITSLSYVVGADKGFNYSLIDEAFVCQKKNHFQVTCQIHVVGDPQYIKTSDGFKKINQFFLHFYGVKAEDPTQEVRIEQSQSDRTKKPFHPVPVELRREGTKVTVGRLHFAETTNNNMRKKGRPNPDQRHFQLVVGLRARGAAGEVTLAAHASDRIIVRASNPGQFESDCSEGWWQRGVAENSVHFSGRVGINTDRPDEACVVNGNLKVMGHIVHPSDARAKHNIEELDTEQQLKNIQSIRVVKFNYDPSFAQHSGLVGFDPAAAAPTCDTGVIAQEVRKVLPEAVKEAGDVALNNGRTIQQFLVVNKDRIFMENLGAVKELCKVTGNLESRVDQLERAARGLRRARGADSARSSVSNDSQYSALSNSSKSVYSDNFSTGHIRDIARNIRKHECCQKLSHNSPKYTRKQCKSCHSNNNTKYAKYYNTNKTNCVRYHKETDMEPPSLKTEGKRLPDEKNDKDTCLWMRDSNTTFCCAKKNIYGETEIISNKFLQIFIAILIFIMAVCLVVMSALYFHEHQALISMKELKLRDRIGWNFNGNGKFNSLTTHRPPGENGVHSNQIQNSKLHVAAKKTSKEKGSHKTTTDFLTTPPVLPEAAPPTLSTVPLATLNGHNNYLNNALNIEQPSPRVDRPVFSTRSADVLGSGCALDNALNAELDVDCQSSCNLDTPQSYDNQEPIENLPEKLTNDTHFISKLEKPIIPIIPERNETKSENDSIKNQLRDEISDAESNFLDPNKVINTTDNETFRRYKRTLFGKVDKSGPKGKKFVSKDEKFVSKDEKYVSKVEKTRRVRRETSEVQRAGSYEFFDHSSSEDDGIESQDCDTMTFGVNSKTFNNESIFEERVCTNTVYNFTYLVPVSRCSKERHIVIVIGFNSSKSKHKSLHLCSLNCKYDTTKSCDLNREIAKPTRNEETLGASWRSTVTLDCNTDTSMTLRASHNYSKDLCELTGDEKVPFIEYNVRIFRDCHN